MIKRNIQAPLSRHSEKFQRGCPVPKTFTISPHKILLGLQAAYICLLLTTDLILFAASGNMDIFPQGALIAPELMIVMLLLTGAVVLTMTALFKFPKVRIALCAFVTFWFIFVLFKQFSQFDHHTFLGNCLRQMLDDAVPDIFFSKSHIILALGLTGLFVWFALKARLAWFAFYVMLFLFALIGILYNEGVVVRNRHDFLELRDITGADSNVRQAGKQKFIYLMLPNLVSYKYFSDFPEQYMTSTQELISGFMAKNDFIVFPNTYHPTESTFSNIIKAVNPFDEKTPADHVMETMMLYKYWKFFNVGDEFVLLKDNALFDTFRRADYRISAYKSRGVDICHKKYGFNVDRCIEKLNRPVNLYNRDLPVSDRSKLLVIEWLNSMGIFRNLSVFYHTLRLFTRPEDLPMIGIDYNNLYVVNSINTFDILADNILSDKGRQAYFVYADIPSDMFVYDQFCRIKPQQSWISLKNLPWVDVDKTPLRRQAYADQSRCLYGKLQEFLDKLDQNDVLKNTVLVINGMSATNNFQTARYADYIDNMFYNQLSMLAIKAPNNKSISIRETFCTPESILNQYLYKTPACTEFDASDLHERLKVKLRKKLADLSITEETALQNVSVFDKWYGLWKQNNHHEKSSIDIVNKNPKAPNVEEIAKDIPQIQNITLKSKEEAEARPDTTATPEPTENDLTGKSHDESSQDDLIP